MTDLITPPENTGEIRRGAADETARILRAPATAALADEQTRDLSIRILTGIGTETVRRIEPGLIVDARTTPPAGHPRHAAAQMERVAAPAEAVKLLGALDRGPAAELPAVRHRTVGARHRAPTPGWMVALVITGALLVGACLGAWLVAMWHVAAVR